MRNDLTPFFWTPGLICSLHERQRGLLRGGLEKWLWRLPDGSAWTGDQIHMPGRRPLADRSMHCWQSWRTSLPAQPCPPWQCIPLVTVSLSMISLMSGSRVCSVTGFSTNGECTKPGRIEPLTHAGRHRADRSYIRRIVSERTLLGLWFRCRPGMRMRLAA